MHVVEAGPSSGPSVLFLHGWPQDSGAFGTVMEQLQDRVRVLAIDLPGIGKSKGRPSSADKRGLAKYVHALVSTLRLEEVTLVGHDIGGQIVYAFLRLFPSAIARAAILNVVIPGVPPWTDVIRNPRIWHFGFHAVPKLPELLVRGHEREYFDFFFDAISADPSAIALEARRRYAQAYGSAASLRAGFDWYRAFPQDEQDNVAVAGTQIATPVLYVRGEAESGSPEAYLDGLRSAGLTNLRGVVIPRCGHFSADEQPAAVARALSEFMQLSRSAA